jgi:integrase
MGSPFRRGSETLIRKQHEDNQRRRRLTEDEEATLLSAAAPFLRSMMVAALDTGMRRGEMLALRFADIDMTRLLIRLRGATTKSRKTRFVPIATERLRAVLKWLQINAAGSQKPDEALVFSDEAGEPVGSFRTARVTAVLKAHGVELTRMPSGSPVSTRSVRALETELKELKENGLGVWLGGRDSNPDNVVQSHGSYR